MKSYGFLRYARIFITPTISAWNGLITTGQFRSLICGKPVNAKGEPVPWFTYGAINFLDQQQLQGLRVFEFGTGNSTLYWVRRGCEVRAVEADENWANYVRSNTVGKAEILHVGEIANYPSAILDFDNLFDIIIVDGADRPACAEKAVQKLAPGGYIILDNSEAYSGTAARLRDAGLVQVDFIGPAPLIHTWQATSFFFKRDYEFQGETAPRLIKGMIVYPSGWTPR